MQPSNFPSIVRFVPILGNLPDLVVVQHAVGTSAQNNTNRAVKAAT